jgi:hypothetical protein
MTIDYFLFIHGVNTREVREEPEYANDLIKKIEERLPDRKETLKFLPLYWGDVNKDKEEEVLKKLEASPVWNQMWFREFRSKQLLQFAGDAALYISRHVGSKVVNKLKEDAQKLKNAQPEDRLHLVTHSWGTIILFDVLFANRWNEPNIPGHNDVMAIRDFIFGISGNDPNPLQGIKIASIHTMGSPIAIFSLTQVESGGHDITPNLEKLLENLHTARQGKKLPWRNFIHPGDPIAYPLKELMPDLLGSDRYLEIQDLLTNETGLFDFLKEPLSQTTLALLQGGDAHGSYWRSEKVVKEISSVLL